MRKLCLTAMFLALAAAAGGAEAGRETLTNDDIISLFKAQLDKDLVVSKIKNSNNIFDVSAKAMINLKEQGVPDDVIAIMIDQVHDQKKTLSKKVSLAIQHLTSKRPETRTTALLYLQRLGGIAYPYLREALGSSRAPIRAAATKTLARLGDQGSLGLIRILLTDTVPEVRYAAAESLARLKDKDSIQMAKKAVVNGAAPLDAYIRLLGCYRDKQSVGFIRIRLLKNSDWRTRAQAAWALGEIRSPQGREALEHSLLQDGTKEVRREAAVALGKLGIPQSADALMHVCKVDSYARREALLALGNFPPKIAVPFLIKDALAKNKNQLAPPEVAAILQSLRQLTNQDYGPDVDRWLLWWEKNKDRLGKLDGPPRDAVAPGTEAVPEGTQGINYVPPPPVLRKEPWEEEGQATLGVQPQPVAAEIKSPPSAQPAAVALEPDPGTRSAGGGGGLSRL
ncbi:MAG: HEAT repeat domain-containing protein [bacterium]